MSVLLQHSKVRAKRGENGGRRRGGRGVRRERIKREDADAMNARLAGKFASKESDDEE